jgi:HCO3- transporter family
VIVFVLSFFGLPWVCGATVQSLNHVRSMANVKTVSGVSAVAQVVEEVVVVVVVELPRADLLPGSDEEGEVEVEVEKEPQTDQIDCDSEGPSEVQAELVAKGVQGGTSVTSEVFSDVIETRLTGFIIHASILSSLLLLPSLGNIPIPVISGIFLYLGKKMMKGNLFLERLGNIIIEKPLLPKNNIFNLLPTATVLKYLLIQSLMLMLIWVMKQNKNFSLFFPSCIAFLMIVRSYVMPNFFSKTELELLDPEM